MANAKELYKLVKNGELSKLEKLVDSNPELLNQDIIKGYSLLALSVSKSARKPTISNWLIEKGVDLDTQEAKGFTPLMLACKFDQPETAKYLIERGADVHIVNYSGWNALMMAARYDQPETVKLLIDKGVQLDETTDGGSSALMLACQSKHEDHHTEEGLLRSIKHLFAAGASTDIRDNTGKTAMDTAKSFQRRDAVEFLQFALKSNLSKILHKEMQLPRYILVALHDFEIKTVKKCKKLARAELKKLGVHHSSHQLKILRRFNPSAEHEI